MTGEQIIDNLITSKKATCYIRNSEILIEMKKGELLKLINGIREDLLNGILEDLLDDESLKDESNGRNKSTKTKTYEENQY